MSPDTTVVQGVFLLTAVVTAALAAVLWRYRDRSGAIPFAVTNLGIAFWTLCLLFRTMTGRTLSPLFNRLAYVGIVVAITATLLFALEYTGRGRYVDRSGFLLLSAYPVLTLFFVFVNPGNLFFGELHSVDAPVGYRFENGPLFHVHTLVAYSLILVALGTLLEYTLRARQTLYREQAIVLILAAVSPLVANVGFLFGPIEIDITPVGFLLTDVLITFAIGRYQLVRVAPIARDYIVETVSDGLVVVDTRDQIIDINPAARDIFGTGRALVGNDIQQLFDDVPELRNSYRERTENPELDEQIATSHGWDITATESDSGGARFELHGVSAH